MASTAIVTRQIADGAIIDIKVAAGAAIASSKLADGANFLKKDGSVALTGALNAGNNLVSNVTTPSSPTDAANKAYVDGLYNSFPNLFKYKDEVKAAMTANVTVSNPGTAVFDGVTLSSGDRLLLTGQSAGAENGIYTFNTSGTALTRAEDADVATEFPGMMVGSSSLGTANGSKLFLNTNATGSVTLGSTALAYTLINAASGYTTSNFVESEVPSGAINGSNTAFTLANTPTAGSVKIYLNGLRQNAGAGNDYTIVGNAITYLTAPLAGDIILIDYRK
ncbi:MAG: hypothetical protein H0X33_14205 [Taibaiella sp.]|nr:hypothetical protein [Taibaiella sp.]